MAVEFNPINRSESEVSNNYARDSWFKGYTDGNLLVPQNFYGIRLFVSEGLLRDQPEKLEDFKNSILSPKQLESLGNIAAGAHKTKGVHVNVDEERLQRLWGTAKNSTITALNSTLGSDAEILSIESLKGERAAKLNEMLAKIVEIFKTDHDVKDALIRHHRFLSGQSVRMAPKTAEYPFLVDIFRRVRKTYFSQKRKKNFNDQDKKAIDYFLPPSL